VLAGRFAASVGPGTPSGQDASQSDWARWTTADLAGEPNPKSVAAGAAERDHPARRIDAPAA